MMRKSTAVAIQTDGTRFIMKILLILAVTRIPPIITEPGAVPATLNPAWAIGTVPMKT
jgi:hypothetical protein